MKKKNLWFLINSLMKYKWSFHPIKLNLSLFSKSNQPFLATAHLGQNEGDK